MSQKSKTNQLIIGALIAALYAGLTYLSNVFGLAYGPVQLRISEVLTVLPVFTPAAIGGLTVGCFIANIGSFNLLDCVFGTIATLAAAAVSYLLRNRRVKNIPFLSFLAPVIINSAVIGAETAVFFLQKNAGLWGFVISALEIGAGEIITCLVLGIPFYFTVDKYLKKL